MLKEEEKKTARLEARLPQGIYEIIQRAAEVEGRSITDFVVTAVKQAAERTIEQRELMTLSFEDQERFAAALIDPQPLAPALERAAIAHDELIEPS